MLDTLLRADEDLIPASNGCRVHRVSIEVLVIGRLIWPVHSGAKRGATTFPREQVSTPANSSLPRHCMFLAGTPCRSHIMRTILVCLSAVMASGIMASQVACSRDNEAVQAADTSIGIETSPMFVTIENKAGGPLLDVTVAIQTPGPTYTSSVTRLEAGQKQELALSSFSSRDRTTFNLRLMKPRAVHVTATDLASKKYEAQAPWK
jgi:hypothetical protein